MGKAKELVDLIQKVGKEKKVPAASQLNVYVAVNSTMASPISHESIENLSKCITDHSPDKGAAEAMSDAVCGWILEKQNTEEVSNG